MVRKVDFVDDEEIGTRDAGTAFPRDLLALRHVDHVDGEIGEFG